MANFNEHSLEMSIMDLFQDEGYIYLNGEQIHRERSEVLLIDDLRKYLLNRYASEGLTPSEVDSIILRLRSISGTIYEANKAVCKMICDGFIFNREDHTKKDLYIELIDFDEPEKNVFKIVNQFEIEGINNQLRIPDGIVFINGIPVVVLEFKSAVKENTTIMDAYTQLTVRYRRVHRYPPCQAANLCYLLMEGLPHSGFHPAEVGRQIDLSTAVTQADCDAGKLGLRRPVAVRETAAAKQNDFPFHPRSPELFHHIGVISSSVAITSSKPSAYSLSESSFLFTSKVTK